MKRLHSPLLTIYFILPKITPIVPYSLFLTPSGYKSQSYPKWHKALSVENLISSRHPVHSLFVIPKHISPDYSTVFPLCGWTTSVKDMGACLCFSSALWTVSGIRKRAWIWTKRNKCPLGPKFLATLERHPWQMTAPCHKSWTSQLVPQGQSVSTSTSQPSALMRVTHHLQLQYKTGVWWGDKWRLPH